MVGFLVGELTGNDSHATQVSPGRWALHGGLGPKVNHSCDPNCGVRLNDGQAFDFVARHPIAAGQELTFDYAMRNFTIDHFPAVCLCGASRCRGSVTGWKDLPESHSIVARAGSATASGFTCGLTESACQRSISSRTRAWLSSRRAMISPTRSAIS